MIDYQVKQGDSLPLLAAKFFGNSSEYLKIYYANPQIQRRGNEGITSENYLRTGETLRIPTFSGRATPKKRIELPDALSVFVNNKEIAVTNLTMKTAFDSTANAFSFDYSLFENGEIKPFGYEEIQVFVGEICVLSGIIYDIFADGNVFKCSGKSFTSLLEDTCISGSDLGFSFADTSIKMVANRFAQQYGINFRVGKGAEETANRILEVVEFSETEPIMSVISDIGRNIGLYLACDNMNNVDFRPLNYTGENIGFFNNKEFPMNNLSVNYRGSSIFSLYSLHTGASDGSEVTTQNRMLSLCNAQRIRRFRNEQNEQLDVLGREITKGLISCLNVSFSLPFVVYNGKFIQAGQTFDLIAENYGIKNKTRLFIVEVTYNFNANGATCNINACSAEAVSGREINGF